MLCTALLSARAWDGSGSSSDPYLIQTSADWKQLADDVLGGESYSGKYFEMTTSVDAEGVSVGSESRPFSGIFDGGMYTLTYNRGGATSMGVEWSNDYCAPFVLLDGATVRNLKVTGQVFSSHMFAAGIVSRIGGIRATTLSDCHVRSMLSAGSSIKSDASFGGLVGIVNSECIAGPTLQNCSFTGEIRGWANSSAGMVGWTSTPVTFQHCMVDPASVTSVNDCATYYRNYKNVACLMEECYFTQAFGISQGEAVFNTVKVPEGCEWSIESDATINFDGEDYWQSGAVIRLTAPDGFAFNHWEPNFTCQIDDPWIRSGIHVVRDLRSQPIFILSTSMPGAKLERTMDGTRYRYLSNIDYCYYLSREYCDQKGYCFDEDGWLVKMVDGTKVFVTAVTGWESGSIPSDGAQIHNDLVGDWHDHTLMACIAPHAFEGCTELKTLYFKDTDATHYNAKTSFDFIIGNYAFANCPNLTEVKMMQYTTEGTNHWEALKPAQIGWVGADVFAGSPQACFSTDATQYQSYLNDDTWTAVNRSVVVYDHIHEDMKVFGAIYSDMRNTEGEELKNDAEGHAALMETLRYWNADYQQFTASSLLADSDENIWYTQVVGVDDNSLIDGTMRIYNDPGSYYNYKTIALRSLGGNKNVRNIEFHQTNGRSSNSYSDLKMVIQNGALKGCDNLREIYLFYTSGDKIVGTLGPNDVIPGDDIFGLDSYTIDADDEASVTRMSNALALRDSVRIVVATNRYQEFLDDPNWQPYLDLLVPQDAPNMSDLIDYTNDNVTYGFMTSPGGIFQTSQTVSQDVSWWSAPRIIIEVAFTLESIFKLAASIKELSKLKELVKVKADVKEMISEVGVQQDVLTALEGKRTILYGNFSDDPLTYMTQFCGEHVNDNLNLIKTGRQDLISVFHKFNLVNNEGYIANAETMKFVLDVAGESPRYMKLLKTTFTSAAQSFRLNLHQQITHCQKALSLALNKLPFAVERVTKEGLEEAATNYLQSLAPTVDFLSQRGLQTGLFGSVNASCVLASQLWGSGNNNAEDLRKGMRANILSNIHQVGLVGGGYIITTPQKNLSYHTYVKSVADQATVTIQAGSDRGGQNANTTTTAIARDAFRNKKNLQHICFCESEVTTNEAVPMLLTIPDSAFVGSNCLRTLDLRLKTKDGGTTALGPESFILSGNDVFAGVDPLIFRIIIDPSRKNDFLLSESWAPYEHFFVYESAQPVTQFSEYGGNYAYAYEKGSVQKVHKSGGHKIEHTIVTGADTEFLQEHSGALKLINDAGTYNNFQLDGVAYKAFYGNKDLRTVNFTDLKGWLGIGDTYSDFKMSLQDSCFAYCSNLESIDMLYLVTDGDNHIELIKPSQVSIGQGVLEGTSARIKMTPQQMEWFLADSTWVQYSDRFVPCLIQPTDVGFKASVKHMAYYDPAHVGHDQSTWDEYADLSRYGNEIPLSVRENLSKNKDDVRSLADFRHFESLGVTKILDDMFNGLSKMTNVLLPSTLKDINNRVFANCSSLQEVEIPAGVTRLYDDVFTGCKDLKTIIVRNAEPAELGSNTFPKNEGMKIYVPAQSLNQYLTSWSDYKDYIVSDASYRVEKVVKLDQAGTLADKLGLSVEWSYSGTFVAGDEPRYVHGNYSKFDSLTISGPLNDVDLAVIRYLAGCDSYERGGKATDGCLRYLNLYDARIVKDDNKAHYLNLSWGISLAWQCIGEDNVLPPYLFYNCTSLETVILPRSLTGIEGFIFNGCSGLKRVAVTGDVSTISRWTNRKGLLDYPLEELVLLTNQHATSSSSNPWGQPINQVYTPQSQLGDYMNDAGIISCGQSVSAPFNDDQVMHLLADKGEFFPSEYLLREDVEGLFNDSEVGEFDDFDQFQYVKRLDATFSGCTTMKRITLPVSVEYIGADAFSGCSQLDTIRVVAEEPAELAEDAFRSLPADFRILVPRRYAKLYRATWAQYADHINADDTYQPGRDILAVTVTEPNTLGKALGLETKVSWDAMLAIYALKGVRGDYSDIRRIKVSGPIGAIDLDLLKYMAGYCAWSQSRNYSGHLEYIDLYDADLTGVKDYAVLSSYKRWDGTQAVTGYYVEDDVMPEHAFLCAYSLQTLVLPKTCKQVNRRAMQECEGLETLVLGDDMEDFNWNALDDDAMLTRMYILARKKVEISTDWFIWRWLCNNYNPTFDAFYVRPSQYHNYLIDEAYTGSSWQRTNNISTGVFTDDASFCAFASHGAATQDELASVTSVRGWFDSHKDLRNLQPLKYTIVDYLDKATLAPLAELEQITMPMTLCEMEEGLFENNHHLRAVDFLLCDPTEVVAGLRNDGFKKYGIDTQQTLAYVPSSYGSTDETNVVVEDGGTLRTATYRLTDSLSYVVPYSFEAAKIENSRKMSASAIPYTLCVPYQLSIPKYTRAYKLDARDGTSLVFTEVQGNLEAMHPYLLKVVGNKRLRRMSATLNTDVSQTIPATGPSVFGRQDDAPGYSIRGTFEAISNAEAQEMGAYILQSDGDWHPVGASTAAEAKASILPYRAFLLPSARNGSARISMTMEDTTTDIDTIETIDHDGTHRYYDLNGRELPGKPADGMYIHHGKKYINRQ